MSLHPQKRKSSTEVASGPISHHQLRELFWRGFRPKIRIDVRYKNARNILSGRLVRLHCPIGGPEQMVLINEQGRSTSLSLATGPQVFFTLEETIEMQPKKQPSTETWPPADNLPTGNRSPEAVLPFEEI